MVRLVAGGHRLTFHTPSNQLTFAPPSPDYATKTADRQRLLHTASEAAGHAIIVWHACVHLEGSACVCLFLFGRRFAWIQKIPCDRRQSPAFWKEVDKLQEWTGLCMSLWLHGSFSSLILVHPIFCGSSHFHGSSLILWFIPSHGSCPWLMDGFVHQIVTKMS